MIISYIRLYFVLTCHIEMEQHTAGKDNIQKIKSKHINLRTRIKRLVRRITCFSKTEMMHDLVIGWFINRYELAGCYDAESIGLKHPPAELDDVDDLGEVSNEYPQTGGTRPHDQSVL